MLDTILSLLTNEDSLDIVNSMCPYHVSNRFTCQKCAEVCPTQGLHWENGEWVAAECMYCGKCVSVCPTGVFKLDEDVLLKKALQEEQLIITCAALSKDLPDEIQRKILTIHCLNQLYPELVVSLLAQINNLVIYTEENTCSRCMQFDILKLLQSLDMYGDFTEKIKVISGIEELEAYSGQHRGIEEGSQMGRRDFFKVLFKGGKTTSRKIIEQKLTEFDNHSVDQNQQENEKSRSDLGKRKMLFNGLTKLQQGTIASPLKEVLPFNNLKIEECIFCEICTRLCPANALKIVTEENRRSIQHSIVDCTGCGLCLDVCMAGKLSWGDPVQTEIFLENTPVTLASAEAQQCSNCKEYFYHYPADEELCFPCKKKMEFCKARTST
ncbi:MAG: 4Fe-4S dicluster domain-containing protein [Bacillota bacterium]|nr:4Fe-4S dicluster domain-containing protein [Bacillota bacterium]